MEGARKLKEISYIHTEAYATGELKHGPLALVGDDMPVIAVAPNNALLEKLKSNQQEVRARWPALCVRRSQHRYRTQRRRRGRDLLKATKDARTAATLLRDLMSTPPMVGSYEINW